jgi:hypothetical protein
MARELAYTCRALTGAEAGGLLCEDIPRRSWPAPAARDRENPGSCHYGWVAAGQRLGNDLLGRTQVHVRVWLGEAVGLAAQHAWVQCRLDRPAAAVLALEHGQLTFCQRPWILGRRVMRGSQSPRQRQSVVDRGRSNQLR